MLEGNPAERLRDFVSRIESADDQTKLSDILDELSEPLALEDVGDGSDDQVPAGGAVRPLSRADHWRMWAEVVELPGQVRGTLATFPDDEKVDLLARPLGPIEQMLNSFGVGHTVKQARGKLKPDTSLGLEHLVVAFHRNGHVEHQADARQLASIHRQVGALFSEVEQADLQEDLRQLVLRLLHQVETAIRHYQVTGMAPLDDALAMIYGSLVRDQEEDGKRGLARFLNEDSVGRRVMRVLGELHGAVGAVQYGAALGAAIGLELPAGG